MNKTVFSLAAAGLFASVTAHAAALAPGQYLSSGTVATATSQCTAVGLAQGAANNSVLKYPGGGKTGLIIYRPDSGALQLCNQFPATPAGGLNGFSATAQCAIDSINGNIPAQPVMFAFTSTVEDANSAVGTTKITIPASDAVGGGCVATVNTTIVRSGK